MASQVKCLSLLSPALIGRRFTYVALPVLMSVSLVGCSGKNDASEHNFTVALNQYLESDGDLCMGIGAFPIDIARTEVQAIPDSPTGRAARMTALQQAGLVSASDVSLGQLAFTDHHLTGHRVPVQRFELTTAGRDAYRKLVADVADATGKVQPERSDLCYGKVALDTVKDWEGPTLVNDRREAVVHYTYRIDGVAAWSRSALIAHAFPDVATSLQEAGQRTLTTTMVLTDKGWVVKQP